MNQEMRLAILELALKVAPGSSLVCIMSIVKAFEKYIETGE